MSELATVTSKGQVTIPLAVRDSMHLQMGDRVEFTVEPDGSAKLVRRTRRLEELIGSLKEYALDHPIGPDDIEAARAIEYAERRALSAGR